MDPAQGDEPWNERVRGENEAERADRNFDDLLQELRVSMNGTQILFAFLLTVPFSSGFRSVSTSQRDAYFATLVTSAMSAALLVAPAVMHRVVFRQHMKQHLVRVASTVALAGQGLLAFAVAGATWLIGDYLYGLAAALATSLFAFAWYVTWFFAVPLAMRLRQRRADARGAGHDA